MINFRTLAFVALFGLLTFTPSEAQQLPLFTQFSEQQTLINPAFVGGDFILYQYAKSLGATWRTQQLDLAKGNPTTQILRGDFILKTDKRFFGLATGFQLLNDRSGPTSSTGFYGRLASFGSHDSRKSGFSVGMNAGFMRHQLSGDAISWHDAGDVVGQQRYMATTLDIGIGGFAYNSFSENTNDVGYIGLSVPQIFTTGTAFDGQAFSLPRVPHVYMTAGFYKFIYGQTFIEPSVWLRYVANTPLSIDVHLKGQLGRIVSVGVGYSSVSALTGEVGFLLGEAVGLSHSAFKIGYGFSKNLNNVNTNIFTNAHEVNLTWLLD